MNSDSSAPQDPLTEWQTFFNRDIHTMHQLMLLRTRTDDEQSRRQMYPWIKQIADTIVDLERSVRNLNRYVAEERSQLSQVAALQKNIAFQKERLELMNAQIPVEVSECLGLEQGEVENRDLEKENVVERDERTVEESGAKKKEPKQTVGAEKPKLVRKQSQTSVKPTIRGKSMEHRGSKLRIEVPVIKPVTQKELNEAPQYVKGRLTLDKIRHVTDSLNKIATDKYHLMSRPYRELSSTEKNVYQDFRDNECDETRDKQFLTESEIKGFGNYRLDSTAKSVINMLRHVGALKHVRGKNNSTIFLIN